MSIPRLGVLMPLYNGERFMSESIVSVLEQTFTDFELIIVDDGSSDGSAEIVRSFCARDSRIRGIFLRENVGIAPAMNRGLREMRAALVARVDCDDICVANRFARQVAYMDKHSDIYMLGCRAVNIDEFGNKIEGVGDYKIPFALGRKKISAEISRGNYPLLHPTLMYRTAKVLALGGYRELFPIGEDLDLYERMFIRYGCVFANLSNVLYFYRRYPSSLSSVGGQYNSKQHYWILALISYSSECVRQGLSDPLAFVKDLSFPPSSFSKYEFNIIELLFYLHGYRKLLMKFPSPAKNLRRLCMIRGKLSYLANGSKIRELLAKKFFLLLLPVMPSCKDDRVDFFVNFDDALSNRDGFFERTDYCNFCLFVARGCLGFGDWRNFLRYMFRAFRIDFVYTLRFIFVRSLAHLIK